MLRESTFQTSGYAWLCMIAEHPAVVSGQDELLAAADADAAALRATWAGGCRSVGVDDVWEDLEISGHPPRHIYIWISNTYLDDLLF